MGETSDQLIHEIEEARYALDEDLTALEGRLKRKTNVRVQAGKHPWVVAGFALGVAFLFGIWITRLVRTGYYPSPAQRRDRARRREYRI